MNGSPPSKRSTRMPRDCISSTRFRMRTMSEKPRRDIRSAGARGGGSKAGGLYRGLMRYSAEDANGFSNHRPMALVAIERLGATPERVAQFRGFYERRLRPMSASEEALSDRLH